MNTMGCSMLLLAAAALVVGFIPILTWITFIIALPLSLLAIITAGNVAIKPTAQSADKLTFWVSVALAATIVVRLLTLA